MSLLAVGQREDHLPVDLGRRELPRALPGRRVVSTGDEDGREDDHRNRTQNGQAPSLCEPGHTPDGRNLELTDLGEEPGANTGRKRFVPPAAPEGRDRVV